MSALFEGLSVAALRDLADRLRTGRTHRPFTARGLRRAFGDGADRLAEDLARLSAAMDDQALAVFAAGIADEREAAQRIAERVELVWTGPDVPGTASRDTGVVVRDLFGRATSSVLIAGFAVTQGRSIFEALASRIAANSKLDVRFVLNVARPWNDEREAAAILSEFTNRFLREQWPAEVDPPPMFFDPRALARFGGPRAAMHAKCVVVDRRLVYLGSANFTEAAQERNIEAGVLLDDETIAGSLTRHFDALIQSGALQRTQ